MEDKLSFNSPAVMVWIIVMVSLAALILLSRAFGSVSASAGLS